MYRGKYLAPFAKQRSLGEIARPRGLRFGISSVQHWSVQRPAWLPLGHDARALAPRWQCASCLQIDTSTQCSPTDARVVSTLVVDDQNVL